MMTVIKIANKKAVDELQARLILRLGRKITLQETIDLCIQHANNHFEELLAIASSTPMLSPERAEEIIKRFEKFRDTPYDKNATLLNPEDEEIYSL